MGSGSWIPARPRTRLSPLLAPSHSHPSPPAPAPQMFKNGQKMDTIIGAVPKSTLVQAIEKYL
jgi:hypothetical protein